VFDFRLNRRVSIRKFINQASVGRDANEASPLECLRSTFVAVSRFNEKHIGTLQVSAPSLEDLALRLSREH